MCVVIAVYVKKMYQYYQMMTINSFVSASTFFLGIFFLIFSILADI